MAAATDSHPKCVTTLDSHSPGGGAGPSDTRQSRLLVTASGDLSVHTVEESAWT
jgi:hypothetical protein